jgi:hypothetical protein
MPKGESTHISKKEFKIFCLEVFLALGLWAVEKTIWSVSVCLILMGLIVIPMVRYSEWVQKNKISMTLAFIAWYTFLLVFGWQVWPSKPLHGNVILRARIIEADPIFPYHTGKPILNIWFKNAGAISVRNLQFVGRIDLAPVVKSEDELFTEFKSNITFLPVDITLEPGPQDEFVRFKTITTIRDLTQDDVTALSGRAPKLKLCPLAAILWEDSTGLYESDYCGCLVPQLLPNTTPPIGVCQGHNGETRIR